MKRTTTLTIASDVLDEAKKKGINISEAAQYGIMKTLNTQELEEYPEELATQDPDHFFICALDGKCKKRGAPQFFENKMGHVVPISEDEYKLKLQIMAAHRTEVIRKPPIKGSVIPRN